MADSFDISANPATTYQFNLGDPPQFVGHLLALQLGEGKAMDKDFPVTDPETGDSAPIKVAGILFGSRWNEKVGGPMSISGLLTEANHGELDMAKKDLSKSAAVSFQIKWYMYNTDGKKFFPHFFQDQDFKGSLAKVGEDFDINLGKYTSNEIDQVPCLDFHMGIIGSSEKDQAFQYAGTPTGKTALAYSSKKGA